jgi:hypothetical protein
MVLNPLDLSWCRQRFRQVTFPAGGIFASSPALYACDVKNALDPSSETGCGFGYLRPNRPEHIEDGRGIDIGDGPLPELRKRMLLESGEPLRLVLRVGPSDALRLYRRERSRPERDRRGRCLRNYTRLGAKGDRVLAARRRASRLQSGQPCAGQTDERIGTQTHVATVSRNSYAQHPNARAGSLPRLDQEMQSLGRADPNRL